MKKRFWGKLCNTAVGKKNRNKNKRKKRTLVPLLINTDDTEQYFKCI